MEQKRRHAGLIHAKPPPPGGFFVPKTGKNSIFYFFIEFLRRSLNAMEHMEHMEQCY